MAPDTSSHRHPRGHSPQAHADCMDQAKQRALRLRQLAIEAFWAELARGVRRVLRAAASRRPLSQQAAPCPR